MTTHRLSGTQEYNTWKNMIARCENLKSPAYKDYGGRGITVCPEWHVFLVFFRDMGKRPKGLTLERKNNDLGYCPENCIWATPEERANNKRPYPKNRQPISCGPSEQTWFVAGNIKTRKVFFSNNQSAFAREHKLTREHISDCLRGKIKVHKGWRFKLLKEIVMKYPYRRCWN